MRKIIPSQFAVSRLNLLFLTLDRLIIIWGKAQDQSLKPIDLHRVIASARL
jgi:hypothetical protein